MAGTDRDQSEPRPAVFSDTHAHLSMVAGRSGRAALEGVLMAYDAAYRDALAAGRPRAAPIVLDPGTLADDLPERVRITGRHPWLRFGAGIWPDAGALEDPEPHIAALTKAAAMPECAALGEGGLDYHWMHGTKEAQRFLFEAQIELAERFRKPLIVHSREAHEDTIGILRTAKPGVSVIIHCFGYDSAAAREYLDVGCFVSFAGNITYASASSLREACALVPRDRLLLETDSPYMAPVPYRGKPCTPLLIESTYAKAAEVRGESVDVLREAVTWNAQVLFGENS